MLTEETMRLSPVTFADHGTHKVALPTIGKGPIEVKGKDDPEFPDFYRQCICTIFNLLHIISDMRTPLPLRFHAFEVTLSGLAGGEYLPLPASEGLAFPFLLALDGYPTSPANFAHGQWYPAKTEETSVI